MHIVLDPFERDRSRAFLLDAGKDAAIGHGKKRCFHSGRDPGSE